MKTLVKTLIFFFFVTCVNATTFTWNGGTGFWDDAANWSGGIGIPTIGDDVILNAGQATVRDLQIVQTVLVRGSANLIVNSSGNLQILIGSSAVGPIDALEVNGNSGAATVTIQAGGQLTTSSDFGVSNVRGIYVQLDGTFINHGEVDVIINDTNVAAIYHRGGTFQNSSTGLIEVVKASDSDVSDVNQEGTGISSFDLFQNAGTIIIKDADNDGLYMLGTTVNNGTIEIENVDKIGIELFSGSDFTNNGIIEIENTGYSGFAVDGEFTNGNTGEIYIGSRNGTIGTIGFDGITFSSTVTSAVNRGLIKIDDFKELRYGLWIAGSNFINRGNIDIADVPIVGSWAIVLFGGSISNEACANIRSRSPFFIDETSTFTNEGNIFMDVDRPSAIASAAGNNGLLTNNGQIEDFQASFDLSSTFFINNGYVLQPISGTYELNEAIPNILQGGGAGITVAVNVGLDATGANIIGSYKKSTNEFTATDGAAICGATVFYLLLNTGSSCPVSMRFEMENEILPDAASATQEMEIKVFLDGPFDPATGLMNDDLRAQGLIPLSDPYDLPSSLSQTITDPTILDNYGPDSIVDWVLVELALLSDPGNIVIQVPLLLQRDGVVVPITHTGQIKIPLAKTCESYYLRMRHRNHLGVAKEFIPVFD